MSALQEDNILHIDPTDTPFTSMCGDGSANWQNDTLVKDMMLDILPCPFCGGIPRLEILSRRDVEPDRIETFVSCDCGLCMLEGAGSMAPAPRESILLVTQRRHISPVTVVVSGFNVGDIIEAKFDGKPVIFDSSEPTDGGFTVNYILRELPANRSGAFFVRTSGGQSVRILVRVLK